MDIIKPNLDCFTIYTKTGCSYCEKVKVLLKNKNYNPIFINCDDYLKNDKEFFLNYIEKIAGVKHKTFPIVFKDGIFIGGFTETNKYIDKFSAFDNSSFF